MENVKNLPIAELDPTASQAEIIEAVNKVISVINFMWDIHDPEE